MAIRMMVSKEEFEKNPTNIEVVTDYHGSNGPLYMKTSHVGRVIGLREYNGSEDSDFYATVWNTDKGAPEEIQYASTRGWTYPNGAAVDATPEVQAAYQLYLEKRHQEYLARLAAEESKKPSKGKLVKVVRGRKIPQGTVGRVFWHGTVSKRYGYGEETRVGIVKENGEKIFLSAAYVEVMKEAS